MNALTLTYLITALLGFFVLGLKLGSYLGFKRAMGISRFIVTDKPRVITDEVRAAWASVSSGIGMAKMALMSDKPATEVLEHLNKVSDALDVIWPS